AHTGPGRPTDRVEALLTALRSRLALDRVDGALDSGADVSSVKSALSKDGYTGQTIQDQLGQFQTVISGIVGVLNAFAVIALVAAGFGIINTLLMSVQERTRDAQRAVRLAGADPVALWHGLEPALGLSAITLVGGLALFALRRPVEALQHRLAGFPSASSIYRHVMRGLDRGATALTAGVQRGSLPYYLTVILSVFVAGALVNLVIGGP
ncbi:hypothetical protein IAE22_29515, partial [Bacillus sp. S34]|nr:hypothetical protein [Bacillus sp. S34]